MSIDHQDAKEMALVTPMADGSGDSTAASSPVGNNQISMGINDLAREVFNFAFSDEGTREINHEVLKTNFKWDAEKCNDVMKFLVKARIASPPIQKPALLGSGTLATVCMRPREEIPKLKQLQDVNEYAVYCAVEAAGTGGLFASEVYWKLPQNVSRLTNKAKCSKICAKLIEMKLIKELRSIQNKTRKVYMAWYISPSKSVVGGSFYANGEFNVLVVNSIRASIMTALNASVERMSLKSLGEHIRASALGKEISDDDLRVVLRSLELDDDICRFRGDDEDNDDYAVGSWTLDDIEDAIEGIPCLICPSRESCNVKSEHDASQVVTPELLINLPADAVSATNCQYFSHWLKLHNI